MNETSTNTGAEQLSLGRIISALQDVLRSWRLVIAAVLIAAMLTFVVTDMTYRPQYQATTTFVVTVDKAAGTSINSLNAANTTATLFTEVLNSSLLRQIVLEEAGLPSFNGSINATVTESTNILVMQVRGTDPRAVYLMSEAIIDNHYQVSAQVLKDTVLEVLQAPSVPTRPVNNPNIRRNVVMVSGAAGLGMAVLMAALSAMADKVRSKEEADAKLSCRVLGALYHESKHKMLKSWFTRKKESILITHPLTSFMYSESVHKLASRIDRHRHKGEHVVMVTSFLENEGKSTVAVNLALSMVKKGKRVLLIDCDLRKPACAKILKDHTPGKTVLDVLQGASTLADSVRCMKNGLHVLAGGKSLRAAVNLSHSPTMKNLLEEAGRMYDLVIVDTPPMALAPDAECISEFADAALLVVRQNAAMANDLNGAAAILDKSTHLLGCVLNNVYGSGDFSPVFRYAGYGKYSKYGKYGKYNHYGYGGK